MHYNISPEKVKELFATCVLPHLDENIKDDEEKLQVVLNSFAWIQGTSFGQEPTDAVYLVFVKHALKKANELLETYKK